MAKILGDNKTFAAHNNSEKQNTMFLTCFLIHLVAGLHRTSIGYIASDVYSRYKRHQGYNVLHPMGYDSFGCLLSNMLFKQGNVLRIPRKY
jgi:leucyl-tRNA synthetase